MSLTYDETPLAWPSSVSLDDLTECTTCGLMIYAPQPGSLQVLTRRQSDNVGDGVTIEESPGIGADYRGQRYAFEEAVFHTPGLHVIPGQTGVLAAEYHIHMRTMSEPIRYITIVIPVSHKTDTDFGSEYFSAIRAKPDPSDPRPTLESLFVSPTKVLQYQGPDIRRRTRDTPIPKETTSQQERQFLIILNTVHIRASDLERIPREGSLSTDARDLPALGVKPTKTVPRDRLLNSVVLANPGILNGGAGPTKTTTGTNTSTMRVVVNGNDVVDLSGNANDIQKLLGIQKTAKISAAAAGSAEKEAEENAKRLFDFLNGLVMFFGVFTGLLLADILFRFLWFWVFTTPMLRLEPWEPLKIWIFLIIAIGIGSLVDPILSMNS